MSIAKLKEYIQKKTGKTLDDIADAAAEAGYIAVFIDPKPQIDVVVPGAEAIPADNAENFFGPLRKVHMPVVQFNRYEYNPTCIWYIDPQGVLRQRCI